MQYLPDTLVSRCEARNDELEIELDVSDTVHNFLNLYLKTVVVKNLSNLKREIRVFFSQDYHIYSTDSGDTVMYEPNLKSVIHYKRKRYFLINGQTDQSTGMYQFAIGYKESFGWKGTWKDAEDGILEGNPIAQGSVDSTVSFKLEMQPYFQPTLFIIG
ncbi:MAG: hypothetical protein ACYDIA_20555 [Candidatus Humimicrobiaceae bacterium]